MEKRGKLLGFIREYFDDKELNYLYFSYSFRYFSSSLVSLFVPIYLLTIGYNLIDISLYYLIFFASLIVLIPIAMYLLSKVGIKKIFALGTLFLVAYYPMLYFLDKGLAYPWAALVFGISVALEASASNIALTSFLNKKREGKELSILSIIGIISGIVGPIIGGLVIFKFSYGLVFALSSLLLIFSIIPLFLSKDFKIRKEKFNLKKITKQDTFEKGLAHQINAILMVIGGIFWPIFIYLNLKNVIPLGIISALTSFLMIFIVFYIGRRADKDEKRTLKTGIYLNAPSWILRLLFLSPFGLFFTNLYSNFSYSFIDLSFSKIIFENAKKSKSKRDYFLFREFNLAIGRLLILVIVIFIGNIFWMFLISFFITFGYLLMLKGRKIHKKYKERKIRRNK